MSQKITKAQADTIVGRVIAHRFDEDQKKLSKELSEIARKIAEASIDPELARIMAGLPPELVCWTNNLTGYFRDEWQSIEIDPPLRVPPAKAGRLSLKDAIKALPESEQEKAKSDVDTAIDRVIALRSERFRASREIHKVISSVTTIGKLKQIWPEAEPFLAGLEPTKASLPAVQLDSLNALLKLPPEKVPVPE
jgi:hypothetical protein